MRKKLILPLLAILLLTPWPVAYAYDVSDGKVGHETVMVQAAEPSAAPSWNAFGGAIGGVTTPGDLFYIDATNSPADIVVTLYLTNTQELARCYRYLILKVGIYVQSGEGQWEKALGDRGPIGPEIYITLLNGQVNCTLPGCAKYKVTIDNGCFYCLGTSADGGSISPQFYLTAT